MEDTRKARDGQSEPTASANYSVAVWDTRAARKAARDDQRWFKRNPSRTHRIRRRAPGEFPPEAEPPAGFEPVAVVRQVAPGARLRLPFAVLRLATWPRDEASVHALFDWIAEQYEERGPHVVTADDVTARARGYKAAGGVQ